MKKLAIIAFAVLAMVSFNAKSLQANTEYLIDDIAVENLLTTTQETTVAVNYDYVNSLIPTGKEATMGSKNGWIAFALCWVLGTLGVHRFYLGTKVLTGIGYILTGGGCGIVAFVDWIVLLIGAIEGDISKYEDNPKFFMW